MLKKYADPSLIPDILRQNLNKDHIYFVFATDVALNSWAEWCVSNPEKSGTRAVAMEQFIAWDKFKETFVVSKEKGKHAIPSVLRKAFVYNLIALNAEKPFFKSIINPLYSKSAYSFADWISANLSQLKRWYDRFSEKEIPDSDVEDEDYLILYKKYKEFLGDDMFEPAWVTPDLSNTEDTFIIFYPEQLDDFDEYAQAFKSHDNVTAVLLPQNNKNDYKVYCYKDSRTELRRTALYIRHLMNTESDITWQDIAVHVPDIDLYKPYIKREFQRYCIPFVIRAGEKLTVNSAGSVFQNIRDCVTDNFSYKSIRSLLLNEFIPWKDRSKNESLVRKGSELHCICNYTEVKEKDIWLRTLHGEDKAYYSLLRNNIEAMYYSTDFENLEKSWFIFKSVFLSEDGFSVHADNILSRCITELASLIQIEKDFIKPLKLNINSHYDFFLNEIKSKQYRQQEVVTGVNVFGYKLAACASYKYNIVIDCSQNSLNVTYRPMSFLNSKKRLSLGFFDSDKASGAFIALYAKADSSEKGTTIFSSSENTFSGFSIPHSFLRPVKLPGGRSPFEELDSEDFILAEKKRFINGGEGQVIISDIQKSEFMEWTQSSDYTLNSSGEYCADENLIKKTDYLTKIKRSGDQACDDSKKGLEYKAEQALKNPALMKIAQSDMEKFFPCQRKWILKDVLKLHEDNMDINLLNPYDQGNINHKILELLFDDLKKLPVTESDGTFGENEKNIKAKVDGFVRLAIDDKEMSFASSPMVKEVLHSQEEKFSMIIMNFIHYFCSPDHYGGYRVLSQEQWLCGQYENTQYALSGKVDCILASSEEDGEVVIIDYKNTSLPSIKECNVNSDTQRLENFQCCMYMTLWSLNNPSVPAGGMGFNSIRGCKEVKPVDEKNPKKNFATYEPSMNALKDYADRFYDYVSHGRFTPVTEGEDIYNKVDVYSDCYSCDYKTICRTAFSVAGHRL